MEYFTGHSVLLAASTHYGPQRLKSSRMFSLVTLSTVLQLLLLLLLGCIQTTDAGQLLSRGCELKCKNCPQLQFCTGEVVKDHCGCCQVCSSDLYQPHVRLTPLPNKNNACEKVKCPKFKVCKINLQGLPLCSCPSIYMCRRRRREVCGDDFTTYKSRCHMRVAACVADRKISVVSKGSCQIAGPSSTQDSPNSSQWHKSKNTKKRKKRKRNKRRQRKKSKKRNRRRREHTGWRDFRRF
ncbi:agrin [Octopus bimaculoides]|uniref:Kazal-like domain-containing protein n=1 Tax=Octopus bimaculoides TaxID=37653 RepID=A0A0L8FKC5_OCTBM|nr:agrin [Octopus bimaculoides]XP_052831866.1 agrin [Octopus bimaculoides]|eukprot:XP_014789225.1 PREDICTED: agrin-like [Octopus bimaculoides]